MTALLRSMPLRRMQPAWISRLSISATASLSSGYRLFSTQKPVQESQSQTSVDNHDSETNINSETNDRLRAQVLLREKLRQARERLEPWVDRLQTQLVAVRKESLEERVRRAAEFLNHLTGYDAVERRKHQVHLKHDLLTASKEDARRAKLAYEESIEERRKCQRELNLLQQRRDAWTELDITRFTELYRRDMALEQAEAVAKSDYKSATERFEKDQIEFLSEIRERYIEEQMYSDKIRQASTWWTWGLITTHLCIFIAIQLFVEPRKKENLKRDMINMIQRTSERDRELFAEQIKRILDEEQSVHSDVKALSHAPMQHPDSVVVVDDHILDSQQPEQDPSQNSSPDLHAQNTFTPPKRPTILESTQFWQGACAGAVISFASYVLFLSR